jgi:hypothetical protein
MRRCIHTIGPELNAQSRKTSNFHKDSITAMEVNFDSEILITGGRRWINFQNKPWRVT